jgi:hypothetical protein
MPAALKKLEASEFSITFHMEPKIEVPMSLELPPSIAPLNSVPLIPLSTSVHVILDRPPLNFPHLVPSPPNITSPITVPRRRPYGRGVDAERSARYRRYDVEHSPVYTLLRRKTGRVSKSLLLKLIEAVIERAPPSERPEPPGRNQRRAKGGLVLWLDSHYPLFARVYYSGAKFN